MLFSTSAAILAFTTLVSGAAIPLEKRATVTDADILQYALTLEHLENAFYKATLSKFPLANFTAAGFSASFYDQLKYITHDEESHVLALQAGLTAAGAKPVAACTYAFPMSSPKDFVALSATIEGLGVSAYLGGAPLIASKTYLTIAGSILVTEAIHQSAARNAAGLLPMANAYGTPLGLNAVYSIASGFITSCPSTNAALPVMAYPAMTLISGLPTAPGAMIDVSPKKAITGTIFATFVSGLNIFAVPTTMQNGMVMATVPMAVEGQSYVFLTANASGNLTDANILAGPSILQVTPGSPTFDLTIL